MDKIAELKKHIREINQLLITYTYAKDLLLDTANSFDKHYKINNYKDAKIDTIKEVKDLTDALMLRLGKEVTKDINNG